MFHRELDERKRCLARTVCETSPDCVRDGLCFAQLTVRRRLVLTRWRGSLVPSEPGTFARASVDPVWLRKRHGRSGPIDCKQIHTAARTARNAFAESAVSP